MEKKKRQSARQRQRQSKECGARDHVNENRKNLSRRTHEAAIVSLPQTIHATLRREGDSLGREAGRAADGAGAAENHVRAGHIVAGVGDGRVQAAVDRCDWVKTTRPWIEERVSLVSKGLANCSW